MADYRFVSDGIIQRAADGAYIPPDPANADYRAYLAWLAGGNQPDPPPVASGDDATFAADPWTF